MFLVAYQMPHKNLRPVLDSKVQRCIHGRVLHLRVDINMDAEQEEDTLHILVENSKMEEVLPPSVHLKEGEEREKGGEGRGEELERNVGAMTHLFSCFRIPLQYGSPSLVIPSRQACCKGCLSLLVLDSEVKGGLGEEGL